MKRFLATLMVLMTIALPAMAEDVAPIVGAKVAATSEYAILAPVSGVLETYTARVGDAFAEGDTLFRVRPQSVYATVAGKVAAVYIQPNASADAAVTRYGAAVQIERADRYEITASVYTGYNREENRNPYVGTQVWARSANKKHFADGVITAVNGRSVTVQILGGDLVFSQDVKVYLSADYDDKSLLIRGSLSAVQPASVTASGTILTVNVKKGDAVKPGDLLFTCVPDTLAPYTTNPCVVTADEPLIVATMNVTQGMSVQKDQALCTVYPDGAYQLVAEIEESDLGRVTVGSAVTVTFDELAMQSIPATVASVSAIGSSADTSLYTVRLDFAAPEGVRIGMHATVSFAADEPAE